MNDSCVLCTTPGGTPVWQGARLRVIRADEPGFPAFYRVVWTEHAAEFSDLSEEDRMLCMQVVAAVERVLRVQLDPTKIKLAALGNMVPHLHRHVIARFDWDSHFPAPIWALSERPRPLEQEAALAARLPEVDAHLVIALQPWS
ncbi:MAG: HIT family protein [Comamonas sp.]